MGTINPGQPPSNTPTGRPVAASLPTPGELHQFLVKQFRVRCRNPDEPFPFWSDGPSNCQFLSNEFVQEVSNRYCSHLRNTNSEKWKQRRCNCLGKDEDLPSTEDLFHIAGAPEGAHRRMLVCMRMARVSQKGLAAELGIALSKLNKFINGKAPNYGYIDMISDFLGVHKLWMKEGPKACTLDLENNFAPLWLTPWRSACHEGFAALKEAVDCKALRWRKDLSPPGYDFGGFWAKWQADPSVFPIKPPLPPAKMHEGTVQARDPVGSLLAWMFCCRTAFNAGDPTFTVTMTAETVATVEWLAHYYLSNPPAKLTGAASRSSPIGKMPTAGDIHELRRRLPMKPGANPGIKTPNGKNHLMFQRRGALPEQLPSDVGKTAPGPKAGSSRKKRTEKPASSPPTSP